MLATERIFTRGIYRMTEKIFFQNSNGQKLCGILEESNETKETKETKEEVVIIVHGYSSSKDGLTAKGIADVFTRRGINHFRIELDGCGESEGEFENQTITSAVDDISVAIKLMKEKGYKKINLLGSSMGGVASMAAALKHPELNKIGLKAPVSDYPSQRLRKKGQQHIDDWKEKGYNYYEGAGGRKLKVNYSFFEDSKKYVMYDRVKSIKCPVLIIHGDADQSVDVEDSKRIVQNFPKAELVIIKGADHGLEINGDRTLSNKLFAD